MALWKVVFGIIVYFAVPSLAQKNGEDFLLEIPQGRLLGEWRTSFGGKPYAAFEGVPYARPPVGDLRFRDPQKAEKWNGLLLAKTHPNVCSQWIQKYEDAVGSEDCLFVNVYSPNPSGNKLPVIVYIHGGAFVYGTSNTYKPDFLLDNQVIYVSLQYRLGVLGFMSTQDAVLPGNLGLKDQSMALRWVKDNIRHFGGDPDRITITGMSAGGASVHLHLLNPQSKGLFRNAISMSGTALCPWVLQEAPLQKSRLVASNLGCPTDNSKAMVDCLRKRPAADVVKTIAHLTVYQFAPFSPWAPVVEPAVDGAFLTVHPYETVLKGLAIDVPWIVSITSEEGLYPAAIYVEKPEYLEHISKEWNTLAPHIYDFNYTLSLDKHSEAAQKIKDYYFGGKDLSMETFSKFIDSLTHRHFSVDAEKTARLQAVRGSSPVYYYHFAYRGATSMSDGKSNSKVNYGVSHGDDTGYVINVNYQDPTTTAQDREMIKVMTKMWVSFAQNGTPNIGIKWLPIAMTQDLLYLAIESPTKIGMKVSYYIKDDALDFWTSLGLDENDNFVRKRVKDEL